MTLPTPHAGQKEILKLTGRFRVAVCGRRFGKNVLGAIVAEEHVRTKATKQAPRLIWWLAPTQEQSERQERDMARWLTGSSRGRPSWRWRKAEHALEHIATGSRIEFHTANLPDNLRGGGLDLVIIDESADVTEYAWRTVVRPMLIDKRGEALLLGTPRGKNNWLHRLFLRGQSDPTGTWQSVRLPTSANPLISVEEIEALRSEMTEFEFRQEVLAEFCEGVNSFFRGLDRCIIATAPLQRGRPGAKYTTGIDLGKHRDWTALVSINNRSRVIEAADRWQKLDWTAQIARVQAKLDAFPGLAFIDRTGIGDVVFDHVKTTHHVIPTVITGENREKLLTQLAHAIENRRLWLPAGALTLLNELQSFSWVEDSAGHFHAAAPADATDDELFALALAWRPFAHQQHGRHWVDEDGGFFG